MLELFQGIDIREMIIGSVGSQIGGATAGGSVSGAAAPVEAVADQDEIKGDAAAVEEEDSADSDFGLSLFD